MEDTSSSDVKCFLLSAGLTFEKRKQFKGPYLASSEGDLDDIETKKEILEPIKILKTVQSMMQKHIHSLLVAVCNKV